MASTNSIRTVAVTGATGFVGRTMVRELLAQGYAVRALIRDKDKAKRVLPSDPRLALVTGDVHDGGAVADMLRDCQACVHLVGIIREVRRVGQTFQRMHVEATRVVVAQCQKAGVQRYLHMSALGVRDVGVAEYQHTKFEAEQVVQLSDLDWTIFRPGLIHGPEGEFVQMAVGWCTSHQPPFFFLPYFTREVEDQRVPLGGVTELTPSVQPVAVEDVAKAFAAALRTPASVGEIYNLAGSERLTWPQMLRFIRDSLPTGLSSLQPFGLPAQPVALAAEAANLVGMGQLLPFDAGMARMGAEDATADLTKLKEQLGVEPRAFRASFAQYAGQLH